VRRWLFNFAAVASLVLCTGAVLLWLFSFLEFSPFGQSWLVSWDRNGKYLDHGWIASGGSIYIYRQDWNPAPPPAARRWRYTGVEPMPGFQPAQGKFGFAYRFVRIPAGQLTYVDQQLRFPGWVPVVLLVLIPARWFSCRTRLRRRQVAGACLACGYSLTGNTSGTCPECGTPIKQTSDMISN
jgi:hypothetical protein